jgi:hypothetical protein
LEALESLGIRVSNLTTVSGGSLIGAFYAVGGDPHTFAKAIADGRLDLKREMMLAHNAIRMISPLEVPGVGVRMIPLPPFDRLDVQRSMIERVLFSGSPLHGGFEPNEPAMGAPHLMIAVSDLTYGAQIGMLPDGILRLGTTVDEVLRGDTFKAEKKMSLAERVAVSGAFPVAFPPRPWKAWVHPISSGVGSTRELLLADGGLRDNTGYRLLRVADSLVDPAAQRYGVESSMMPADWDLDAFLMSDGGAVLGVFEEPPNLLNVLPRAFDLGAITTDPKQVPTDPCGSLPYYPASFSPTLQLINPDQQFHLKEDSTPGAALDRPWNAHFSPAEYPEAILKRILELLPAGEQPSATTLKNDFLRLAGPNRIRDRVLWYKEMKKAFHDGVCNPKSSRIKPPAPPIPGTCEALALREKVTKSVFADLEIFHKASTLDDRLSKETVASLERLGKMLVYLRWPLLESNLNRAADCKEHLAPVPVERDPLAQPPVHLPTPKS